MRLRPVVLIGTVLGLLTTCSSDGGTGSTPASTRSSVASSSSATSAGSVPGSISPSTSQPGSAAVAEAEGWRLTLSAPLAGSTIGPSVRLCYELTGTSREPDAALDVRVSVDGKVRSASAAAVVGRGSTVVRLPVGSGAGSLAVQLRAEGREIPGVSIEVPVRVASDREPADCG